MKTASQIIHSTQVAFVSSVVIMVTFAMIYVMIEPQITNGQSDTGTFTVQATVTGESSFLVPPTDVTMVGTLNGLTGGSATGTSEFVVQSNSATGYYVDIAFFDNGTDNAMLGDSTGNTAIHDYGGDEAGPQPSFGISASTSAQFAYTVTSDVTSDTPQSFRDLTSACNASGGTAAGNCWKSPAVSAFEIARRASTAPTGATSTVTFNITVPNNPSPVPAAEQYTATATLSLFNI